MPRKYVRKSDKQLERTNLEAAFKHRVATNCSIKAAAEEFGVKKTTLVDAFNRSKKLSDGVTYVPVQAHSNRVFTPQQELHIVEYSIQTAKMFYGLPMNEVRRMVYQYAKACGSQTIPDAWEKDRMATRDWYYSFMDRYPIIQERKANNLWTHYREDNSQSDIFAINANLGNKRRKREQLEVNEVGTRTMEEAVIERDKGSSESDVKLEEGCFENPEHSEQVLKHSSHIWIKEEPSIKEEPLDERDMEVNEASDLIGLHFQDEKSDPAESEHDSVRSVMVKRRVNTGHAATEDPATVNTAPEVPASPSPTPPLLEQLPQDDLFTEAFGDSDDVGTDPSPTGDRPTKVTKLGDLTQDEEDELVAWFDAHPMYYDQTRKNFKDRSLKTRVMDEKAKEMGLNPTLIWTWFKSMRTIYGKLKKRKSGQAAKPFTPRQQWMMTSFHFLDSHLTVRTESRQLGAAGPSTEAQPEEIEVASDSASTTLQKKASSLTKAAMIEEALVHLTKRVKGTGDLAEQLSTAIRATTNERVAFGHWLGLEACKLKEAQWQGLQTDIFAALVRWRQADVRPYTQAQPYGQQPPPTPLHQPPPPPLPLPPQQQQVYPGYSQGSVFAGVDHQPLKKAKDNPPRSPP